MSRIVFILFIAGLYLIGSGGYNLYIQAGTSREPTTISVADLQKAPPSNRHLIVTGGRPVLDDAVTFYKSKFGRKISGSEIYFIPIRDNSTAADTAATPSLILRIPEDRLNDLNESAGFDPDAIQGVRTTSFDLEEKARSALVKTYGSDAVDRMIILDFHGKVGVGGAIGKLLGGILLVTVLSALFLVGRRSKSLPLPSPPPLLPSRPPPEAHLASAN